MPEATEIRAEEPAATSPPRDPAILTFLRSEGERIELLLRTLRRLGHTPSRSKLIYEQMFLSGIQTLHVVLLVGLFIGMIVSLQTGIELAKLGQQDQIGTIVAISMAREMGPGHTIVTILCDIGTRYTSKLFNREFLKSKGLPVAFVWLNLLMLCYRRQRPRPVRGRPVFMVLAGCLVIAALLTLLPQRPLPEAAGAQPALARCPARTIRMSMTADFAIATCW